MASDQATRNLISDSARYVGKAGALLIFIMIYGMVGYHWIEGWTWSQCLYMTVITISTVGFQEIAPLGHAGQMFTITLIFMGAGALAYVATLMARLVIEGELTGVFARRRLRKRILNMDNHYIICGFGRIGGTIATSLDQAGIPFVVIEINPELVDDARKMGYTVIDINATSDAALREAGIDSAQGVIAALNNDANNLVIALAARELNREVFVICRCEERGLERRLHRAGANIVVSPMTLGGQQVAELVASHANCNAIDIAETTPAMYGLSMRAHKPSGTTAVTVADAVREEKALMALLLEHADGRETLHPAGETPVREGDTLILLLRDGAK